jgi:hypothetical protein
MKHLGVAADIEQLKLFLNSMASQRLRSAFIHFMIILTHLDEEFAMLVIEEHFPFSNSKINPNEVERKSLMQ